LPELDYMVGRVWNVVDSLLFAFHSAFSEVSETIKDVPWCDSRRKGKL
jgi:hypothetical protein